MAVRGQAPTWGLSAATALFLAACHPVEHRGHVHFMGPESGFMQVNARLDCPETSGDLTRSGVASDGATCTYTGPGDEVVSLQLTPLGGGPPQAVLSRLEMRLKSDTGLTSLAPSAPLPPPTPPVVKGKDWDASTQVKDDDDRDDDDDDHDSAASKTPRRDDHAQIDLPGLHISTHGDTADVSLLGLSIHADGDDAQVHAGGWGRSATIEGHDGGATLRIGRADQTGVDSMLIVTSDRPGPNGYRTVGYVAKGPPAGPLVIAAFKAKGDNHAGHDLAGDGLKKLVQLNVHRGLGWLSDSDKDAKP